MKKITLITLLLLAILTGFSQTKNADADTDVTTFDYTFGKSDVIVGASGIVFVEFSKNYKYAKETTTLGKIKHVKYWHENTLIKKQTFFYVQNTWQNSSFLFIHLEK